MVNVNFSLSRLAERAIWPGGKRLQTSGGETAGRNGWYFYILSETNYEPSNMFMEGLYLFLETSKQGLFLYSTIQSSQGGLLWRLAWYLRFFLPNYYGEHTHGDQNWQKSNLTVNDCQVFFPNCCRGSTMTRRR